MENEYKEIAVSDSQELGTAEGYVVLSSAEQLMNWAGTKGYTKEIVETIQHKYKKISILKSMFVEEKYRNKGIGNELLETFLGESTSEGAEVVLLEADTSEANCFRLVEWYEGWGFIRMERERDDYPLLLLEIE